jgi:hypothetical protein
MVELGIYCGIAVALVVSFSSWRAGFAICLLAGFLQDTIRKVMPGEPVYFTIMIGVFIAATFAGAYLRGVRLNARAIHQWNPGLRTPLMLFLLLVLLQSAAALLRTGNPIIAGIGMIAYLGPLPAVLLGYRFARGKHDVVRFIKTYSIISLCMLSGIYLSYMGYEWTVLGSVGEGLIAFSPSGEQLSLHSGFLRSPEVAAWHAATSICMILLLFFVARQKVSFLWVAGLSTSFLLIAILLTGRRKFLVEVFLFVGIYYVFLIWFRKNMTSALLLLGAITLVFVSFIYFSPEEIAGIESYTERGASVQSGVGERVYLMTVDSFQWVVARNGVLGSGAGTGSQGAQHFGGGAEIVGYAAEGGLAKVLAELGVPGLVLLLWLAISLLRYLWTVLTTIRKDAPALFDLTAGMMAFLFANAAVYIIAHQVFGDLFVLTLLGFFLGFILAFPQTLSLSGQINEGDRVRLPGRAHGGLFPSALIGTKGMSPRESRG